MKRIIVVLASIACLLLATADPASAARAPLPSEWTGSSVISCVITANGSFAAQWSFRSNFGFATLKADKEYYLKYNIRFDTNGGDYTGRWFKQASWKWESDKWKNYFGGWYQTGGKTTVIYGPTTGTYTPAPNMRVVHDVTLMRSRTGRDEKVWQAYKIDPWSPCRWLGTGET